MVLVLGVYSASRYQIDYPLALTFSLNGLAAMHQRALRWGLKNLAYNFFCAINIIQAIH